MNVRDFIRDLWRRGFDLSKVVVGRVEDPRPVAPTGNAQVSDDVIYPEAICTGNWMVLFENGEVFPVKYFIGKDQQMLETSKRAVAVMVDGPGERVFLLELGEAPHMALH